MSKTTSLAYIDPFTGDDIKDTSTGNLVCSIRHNASSYVSTYLLIFYVQTGPMEIDEAPTTESLKYLQNGQLGVNKISIICNYLMFNKSIFC